jgi:hypothetical protein
MTRRPTPEFLKARKEVLEAFPTCHWCKRAPSTEVDHLIEFDAGGTDELSNLVGACKPCNSRRGALYVNNKRTTQMHARNAFVNKNGGNFFETQTAKPPTPFSVISENGQDRHEITQIEPLGVGIPANEPRLVSPTYGHDNYGHAIATWTAVNLGRDLFPWQRFFLENATQYDSDNVFVHSTAIASTGRQNGKTSMLAGIVGWSLLELPRIWGRPVRILSTAHELALATEVFEELRETFEQWEESGLCKVTWAYGRHKVVMVDGSTYVVKAATGKKHGGTYDLILCDELWAITESAYFGALKPSQIAVPSPLAILTSTAGDESSKVMTRLREQALAGIDRGEPSSLFMAEWSLPECDPDDPQYWGYANPSLGRTITVRALQDACDAPDRSMWLRAHCNLWVAAAGAWLPPGMWANRKTDEPCPVEKSVLCVDSSVDDSKYVGIRCGVTADKRIIATIEFVADSSRQMWIEIEKAMSENKALRLGITPSLDLHTPERLQARRFVWGYAELLKFTGVVRSMIYEGTLEHTGGEMLAEHVNRAVLVRAQGSVVISSQRSPGAIEMARCLVAAASAVSRPTGSAKPSFASSR